MANIPTHEAIEQLRHAETLIRCLENFIKWANAGVSGPVQQAAITNAVDCYRKLHPKENPDA